MLASLAILATLIAGFYVSAADKMAGIDNPTLELLQGEWEGT